MSFPVRTLACHFPPGLQAQVRVLGGGIPSYNPVIVDASGSAVFPNFPEVHTPQNPHGTAFNLYVEAAGQDNVPVPGYPWYGHVEILQDGNVDFWLVDYKQLGYQPPYLAQWQLADPLFIPSRIPVPTRDQLCTTKQWFQGLQAQTIQYGSLPLFDPVIGWFYGGSAREDRDAVRAAHKAVEDNIITVSLSGQYAEVGQAYQHVRGVDYSQNLGALSDLILENANNGFYTDLRLAGDGQGAGPGYNDPVGLTYGHDWLMKNFPRIVSGLSAAHPYIRWTPAYDAWFYGWDPSQVRKFGDLFRSILGNGAVLCGEFGINGCHAGHAGADYAKNGCFYPYDLFQLEISTSDHGGHNELYWQNSARMLGPAYVRPPDQPAHDDLNPPFYLVGGTERGRFYASCWEDWLYEQVRNQVTIPTIINYRGYKSATGWGSQIG